ncbi:MAG: hypothetical protein P4L33_01475 [Capsulimonadaceae bacterium]|nr:hypothetical protein [Capsulimonadaceae bacterium]
MIRGIAGNDEGPTKSECLAAIRRNPGDVDMRIAAIMNEYPAPDDDDQDYATAREVATHRVKALRGLIARFGNRDALRGAIVGAEVAGWPEICTHIILSGNDELDRARRSSGISLPPSAVGDCINDAKAGEAVDPDNAFFPAMKAVAEARCGHYDAMLHDIHFASTLPKWDTYARNEIFGRWRAMEMSGQSLDFLSRIGEIASVRKPYYLLLKDCARVAIEKAVQQEKRGNPHAGIAIRHDVILFGAVMRTQDPILLGDIIGGEIEITGMRLPAGIQAVRTGNPDFDARYAQIAAVYSSYLKHLGLYDEGRWSLAESSHVVEQRKLGRDTLYKDPCDEAFLKRAGKHWLACALCMNAIILLWVTILSAEIVSVRRPRTGPLSRVARWGAGAASYGLLIISISALVPGQDVRTEYRNLMAMTLAIVWCLASKHFRAAIGRSRQRAISLIVSFAALCISVLMSAHHHLAQRFEFYLYWLMAYLLLKTLHSIIMRTRPTIASYLRGSAIFVGTLVGGLALVGASIAIQLGPASHYYLSSYSLGNKDDTIGRFICAALLAIVFISGTALGVAIIKRRPYWAELLRWQRQLGPVVVSVLMLCYAWGIKSTAALDCRLSRALSVSVQNELRYREIASGRVAPGLSPITGPVAVNSVGAQRPANVKQRP